MSSAKRSIAVVACTLGAALSMGITATAAGPQITRFSLTDSYVDTQTCPGIPIATELTGRVSVKVFSETRVQVHQQLVFEGSGNGKTFTDNENYTEFINPQTGVRKLVGTPINIQIPGHGNVLHDAGVLIADFSTDPPTVVHEGGKHPLFHEGFARLCDYLAG